MKPKFRADCAMRNLRSLFRPFQTRSLLSHLHPSSSKAKRTDYRDQICGFSCTAAPRSHSPIEDDDSSHHLYEPIEGVERLEGYRRGGYHCMRIGDHIHNRYQVAQKLGHGTYSTIWLARDQTLEGMANMLPSKCASRIPILLNAASWRNFPARNKAQIPA